MQHGEKEEKAGAKITKRQPYIFVFSRMRGLQQPPFPMIMTQRNRGEKRENSLFCGSGHRFSNFQFEVEGRRRKALGLLGPKVEKEEDEEGKSDTRAWQKWAKWRRPNCKQGRRRRREQQTKRGFTLANVCPERKRR